jgi:hypothetical protein
LLAVAQVAGTFSVRNRATCPDATIGKGDVIGHVLERATPVVRVVLEQVDVDDIAVAVRSVGLRLSDDVERVIPGASCARCRQAPTRPPAACCSWQAVAVSPATRAIRRAARP